MEAQPGSLLASIRTFSRSELNKVDKNIRGEVLVVSEGMQCYGLQDDEDKTEYFDDEIEVKDKVAKLAEYVRTCNHMVAYTGAGISTSGGIPDYRGPEGVWTLKSKGERTKKGVRMREAIPTPAHMALSQLHHEGFLKFLVTTNCDGLHLRSGIPVDALSELHGSGFKVVCRQCGEAYYDVPEMRSKAHAYKPIPSTGRCTKTGCHGALKSSVVNFGCNLPEDEWLKAKQHSAQCDLALVLGTSLRVSPSCNLVEGSYKNKGHLVIVNLQKTPYDKYAALVIRARTDTVMELLMQELGMPVPQFKKPKKQKK